MFSKAPLERIISEPEGTTKIPELNIKAPGAVAVLGKVVAVELEADVMVRLPPAITSCVPVPPAKRIPLIVLEAGISVPVEQTTGVTCPVKTTYSKL
jgi:hypothetical protein